MYAIFNKISLLGLTLLNSLIRSSLRKNMLSESATLSIEFMCSQNYLSSLLSFVVENGDWWSFCCLLLPWCLSRQLKFSILSYKLKAIKRSFNILEVLQKACGEFPPLTRLLTTDQIIDFWFICAQNLQNFIQNQRYHGYD